VEAEQDTLSPKQAHLEAVNELITHCQQEAAETAEALEHARGLVLEKLQASMDGLDGRYTKLTAERDRLTADLEAGLRLNDESLARALQFRADIIDGSHEPAFDDKRLYLELRQVNVKVKDGAAIIRCSLPIDPLEVDLSAARLTAILSMV
jgi:hypothetical protein